MLKINKSILIIFMVSLFLIIGQISASDTDSMIISDYGMDYGSDYDIDSMMIDDIDANSNIKYDIQDNTDENDLETISIEDVDSLEIREKAKDTSGIVMANDNYSCGPASLATVLNRNGLNLSLNEVSKHTNTSLDGTSMQSLIHAARYYNFTAYGIETDAKNLKEN